MLEDETKKKKKIIILLLKNNKKKFIYAGRIRNCVKRKKNNNGTVDGTIYSGMIYKKKKKLNKINKH